MVIKEEKRKRYSTHSGNPTLAERIEALLAGKTIKVITHTRFLYHKSDKFQRLTFSLTNHTQSFIPYTEGLNYSPVLDDVDRASNQNRKIEIVGKV